jgi:hypothetical protein
LLSLWVAFDVSINNADHITDTLLMNAFNTVNLAAACILTSTTFARELGVPESKWVYPLGGAGTSDSADFWKRPNFYTSPSMSRSLDASLAMTGVTASEIDLFDFYSCFPIVPKLAAYHLNLPVTGGPKPLTLLGGLTSFGGAGNNYSMHALTEMTRAIRKGKGKKGLVLCNGGWLSYQYAVILSKEPRRKGNYPARNPLPGEITDVEVPEIAVGMEAEGEVVVEVCRRLCPVQEELLTVCRLTLLSSTAMALLCVATLLQDSRVIRRGCSLTTAMKIRYDRWLVALESWLDSRDG